MIVEDREGMRIDSYLSESLKSYSYNLRNPNIIFNKGHIIIWGKSVYILKDKE